jgi:cytochrome c oxidase subunit 3
MTEVTIKPTPVLFTGKWHPKKFALLLAIAGIIMMFSALTSAYIVRKAAGNWLEFKLPALFLYNTIVLICSSVTAHLGYQAYLKGQVDRYRWLTLITLGLGLLFLALQVIGWEQLKGIGVALDGNPSGSFIYVISGVHAAHVLGGIGALFLGVKTAFGPFKQSPARTLRIQLVNTYWHFVDALWIYLIIFFIVQ